MENFRGKAPLPPGAREALARQLEAHAAGTDGPTKEKFVDALTCFDSERFIERSGTRMRVFVAGEQNDGPVLLCLHGAGAGASSWALVAASVKSSTPIYALDFRGHGASDDAAASSLSKQQLVEDVVEASEALFHGERDIILVGHSLGGAVAAHAAASGRIKRLIGVAVVDVVEGTAIGALAHMQAILRSRPEQFRNVSTCLQWFHSSGTIRNIRSARITAASHVVERKDGSLRWRVDLSATQQLWREWFEGISEAFLRARCARLLILAGTDRLDKILTIAHMQGKFQLVVVPQAGHFVQEDSPDDVSNALTEFRGRNRPLDVAALRARAAQPAEK